MIASGGNAAKPIDLAAWTAKLDSGWHQLGERSFLGDVRREQKLLSSAELDLYLKEHEPLAKQTMRTLLVTGMVHDLSPEDQRHPEVRARIDRFTPDMDGAIVDGARYLDRLDRETLSTYEHALASDPDASLRIGEALDRGGAQSGMCASSRLKLRRVGTHVAGRLALQPPGMLIDEYLSKVERIAARRGAEVELQRRAATEATRRAIFGDEEVIEVEDNKEIVPKEKRSNGVLKAAGWMAGISVTILGISGGLFAAEFFPAVFGLTAGAIGLVVTAILLIVGLVIESRRK